MGANRQNYHYQRIRAGEWATVSSHETLAAAMARYRATRGRRRVVKVVWEVVAVDVEREVMAFLSGQRKSRSMESGHGT